MEHFLTPFKLRKDMRPDSRYSKIELLRGIRIEMEHTKHKELAKMIAKDHLDEFPDYYKHLVKMEDKLKKEWKRR
jgi:hypothetical protein